MREYAELVKPDLVIIASKGLCKRGLHKGGEGGGGQSGKEWWKWADVTFLCLLLYPSGNDEPVVGVSSSKARNSYPGMAQSVARAGLKPARSAFAMKVWTRREGGRDRTVGRG